MKQKIYGSISMYLVIIFCFFIQSVPAQTVPVNPTVSLDITGTTVTVSWSADNADSYILYAAPYPDASVIYDFDMGSLTSISFVLPEDSAYYVAIRASNSSGLSDWSNIEYFDWSQKTPPASGCGAYVSPGVWKVFDCYNLAAIGKTTDDDPFTPSWRLIGGYWQWGRKGPDSSQWFTVNTPNYAHGPVGPGDNGDNSGGITNWDSSIAADGAWSDNTKTVNDPCPPGFRIPTESQWEGVLTNNVQSTVGTWSSHDTNYSCARFFGSDLMLPAAGHRGSSGGSVNDRGSNGDYWSSTEYTVSVARFLRFYDGGAYTSLSGRGNGNSVRCIAE